MIYVNVSGYCKVSVNARLSGASLAVAVYIGRGFKSVTRLNKTQTQNNKLTYRKEIARQLRTQYVEGIRDFEI